MVVLEKVFEKKCKSRAGSMPVLHTVRRIINRRTKQRACSKHGPYTGPYCPQCYEKAMEDT